MQFSEVIDRRRSIRAFRATAIEEEKINAILAAAQSAPSAGDLQAYRIVVVTDAETKALLAKAALGQQFIAEAPTMLVFFADIRRSKAKYGSRGAELFLPAGCDHCGGLCAACRDGREARVLLAGSIRR